MNATEFRERERTKLTDITCAVWFGLGEVSMNVVRVFFFFFFPAWYLLLLPAVWMHKYMLCVYPGNQFIHSIYDSLCLYLCAQLNFVYYCIRSAFSVMVSEQTRSLFFSLSESLSHAPTHLILIQTKTQTLTPNIYVIFYLLLEKPLDFTTT